MSPIAFVARTGSPLDSASFRYLAISLGLSRYFAAKAAAVGVSFFPVTLTCLSISARALLFLARRNYSSRSLRQGLSLCRGCRAPKLCLPCAIADHQLRALDRSDKYAPRRFFRLYRNHRLVADLGRGILRVC